MKFSCLSNSLRARETLLAFEGFDNLMVLDFKGGKEAACEMSVHYVFIEYIMKDRFIKL